MPRAVSKGAFTLANCSMPEHSFPPKTQMVLVDVSGTVPFLSMLSMHGTVRRFVLEHRGRGHIYVETGHRRNDPSENVPYATAAT